MDAPKEIRKGENLDWDKLEKYLRVQLPDLEGKMSVGQFHGGHANLTYLLQFGDTELVLRRPPFGKIAPGAHDMKREYKVLSNLYKYFPPAPRAYHLCEDVDIIGAKFVIMERRTGVIVRYQLLDCFQLFDQAELRLTNAMIKALSNLHKIEVVDNELSSLGKPEGFLERQLEGWGKRWLLSKTSENKAMDDLLIMLQDNMPETQAISIVHNDIKFDNCQFQPDNPDIVTSIFDWDMTTLGDPLVDFGTTLSYWPDPYLANFDLPVMLSGNFPDKAHLKKVYQDHTGFDLSHINWYESFAYWKGAVIAEQLYHRYITGATKDARMAKFGNTAQAFGELAKMKLDQ